jgi:hypothetical protein
MTASTPARPELPKDDERAGLPKVGEGSLYIMTPQYMGYAVTDEAVRQLLADERRKTLELAAQTVRASGGITARWHADTVLDLIDRKEPTT